MRQIWELIPKLFGSQPPLATRFPSHGSGRPGLVLRTATKLSSVGFEPTAVLTFGLRVRRLNHLATRSRRKFSSKLHFPVLPLGLAKFSAALRGIFVHLLRRRLFNRHAWRQIGMTSNALEKLILLEQHNFSPAPLKSCQSLSFAGIRMAPVQ